MGKVPNFWSCKDCSPVENEENAEDYLSFSKIFFDENCISLSSDKQHSIELSEDSFAFINYKDPEKYESGKRRVWTGRWIGRVSYQLENGKNVILEIKPRFGDYSIFTMIEEAFSCNLVSSNSKLVSSDKEESLIQKLIPFIWASKLSHANQYGVPHSDFSQVCKGIVIRGRLDVHKSLIPLLRQHEVVSIKREKRIDEPIAQIILQAYKKIEKTLGNRISPNADFALNAFASAQYPKRIVSENEYRKIRYKPIYLTYRDVVDFSWQILKSTKKSEEMGGGKALAGFLDMAEIWEIYLRWVLRKNFSEMGWSVKSPSIDVYENTFWKRKIIPDIVMERGNDIVVFDAKWKKMDGEDANVEHSDLDRSDFFQIHSYIDYFKALDKKVVVAGLLYPLGEKFPVGADNTQDNLWSSDEKTKFIVDGIQFKNQEKFKSEKNIKNDKELYEAYKSELKKKADEFVKRLKDIISAISRKNDTV